MKIERFEDLEIWQLARQLVKTIYEMISEAKFSKDFSLVNQVQRSAVSIMSNIAEGFEKKSKKEFVHFLYMAKGSCDELRSQLYIALDLNYINKDEFQRNYLLIEKISKSIGGFIKYLQSSNLQFSIGILCLCLILMTGLSFAQELDDKMLLLDEPIIASEKERPSFPEKFQEEITTSPQAGTVTSVEKGTITSPLGTTTTTPLVGTVIIGTSTVDIGTSTSLPSLPPASGGQLLSKDGTPTVGLISQAQVPPVDTLTPFPGTTTTTPLVGTVIIGEELIDPTTGLSLGIQGMLRRGLTKGMLWVN